MLHDINVYMPNHSPKWKYFYTAKNSILELAGMFYRQEKKNF